MINRTGEDPLWYKDGIIYQLHIKAYKDNNNDGIGDFRGLIEKLDYIAELGVNIIWLLPFYPSPLRDDGYDIADYFSIHPDYGKLEDFKEFLREAHERGIRVITELVLNHTSDQHDWFLRARHAPEGSSYRNYYVWSNTPDKYSDARIIFSDFETSNWSYDPVAKAYYWHRFYSHQPDLNFDNPHVHKQFMRVVSFWLDMGVDGLRLDAVPYLYEREGTNCENLTETHRYLKELNAFVKSRYKDKMLLAEANQWPEDAVAYFGDGDECQMAFHFPLMPRIYMAIQMEERFPIIDILEQTPQIPDSCQWALFLRNHDELTLEMVTDEERDYMYRFYARDNRARINLGIRRRLAPLVENNRRKIELLNILLFSFPGTPIIYYGDEIGMGDNYYLGDRNGVRTPMQWSPDRNAGFSETNPQRLFLPVIIDPEYHYEAINVEVHQRSSSSLLWWMKRAIKIRKNHKAFGRGTLEFLAPSNPKVLAFIRKYEDENILVVANLSKLPNMVELDIPGYDGYVPVEAFSGNNFTQIKSGQPFVLTLNPYDYYWFVLEKSEDLIRRKERQIPEITISSTLRKNAETEFLPVFEESVIPGYLQYAEEYRLKDARMLETKVVDYLHIPSSRNNYYLLLFRVSFVDRVAENYMLPVAIIRRDITEQDKSLNNGELITIIRTPKSEYCVYEALNNEEFRNNLFRLLLERKIINTHSGKINVSAEGSLRKDLELSEISSQLLKGDYRRINILYNNKIILKLYRRLEEGVSPGIEIIRYLNEYTGYRNIPAFGGSVIYKQENTEPFSIGMLKYYTHGEGDAYDYFSSSATQFFDTIHSRIRDEVPPAVDLGELFIADHPEKENCLPIERLHTEMLQLLGKRIAQLHKSMVLQRSGEKIFQSETFSMLYQRSIYQSFRSLLKSTMRIMKRQMKNMTDETRAIAAGLIQDEGSLISFASELLHEKLHARKIRIHGDLHLGQIQFTGKDFIIANFEGQISAAVSERRIKRSPLRDVASVLYSLFHASYYSFNKYISTRIDEAPGLQPHAYSWWICMGSNFLRGYYSEMGDAELIPTDSRQCEYLLKMYLLEKMLYELRYLLGVDGDAFLIPLAGLRMILDLDDKQIKTTMEKVI